MKRYVIFFLLSYLQFWAGLEVSGQSRVVQSFIELPLSDYEVTEDGLPSYMAQMPLTITEVRGLKVYLEYPEYQQLTKEEKQCILQHSFSVRDTIVPNFYVTTARRKNYVAVDFCPIVKRNGEFMRLVSGKIVVEQTTNVLNNFSETSSTADRWKSSSVLATGRWVKIRVSSEGIYSLSSDQLGRMGFSDISKVKVYGYGGRIQEEAWSFSGRRMVADDLCEVACFRDGSSIYFFAEGTVRWIWDNGSSRWIHANQPYSDYSYYFLTDEGGGPLAWQEETQEASLNSPTIQTVKHYAVRDNDADAFYEGGREMYDSYDFSVGNQYDFRLSVVRPAPSSNATIDVAFASSSPNTNNRMQVSLNGENLGSLSARAYRNDESAYEARSTFTTDNLVQDNEFQLSTISGVAARLNYIRITYDRLLDGRDAGVPFSANTTGTAVFQIANATERTHLWRIGDATEPTIEIHGDFSDQLLTIPVEDAQDRYVVFTEGESYPSPEYVEEVENQNLHGDGPFDMVIIVPASGNLDEAANRLAEMHTDKDGLRVKVVRANLLYNEFSSGTPDASAYRRYMKMLYDRAEHEEDMPRYLLLFGDCAWDNRMRSVSWQNYNPDDFLLAFEVNYNTSDYNLSGFAVGALNSYVSDDFYGWLDDGEGENYSQARLDVAVGRIPCHDASIAQQIVDKIIRYRNNEVVGAWKNHVYMLADDVNDNLHMEDAETVADNIFQATGQNINLNKVYWDAYPIEHSATGNTYPQVTKMLQSHMQQGAIMFNYMGHGSPQQVSTSRLLVANDYSASSEGRLPLWVLASCEISPYDRQEMDIGRTAIYNTDGGAIAVVCASRSVYSNYNRPLNASFCRYVLSGEVSGELYTMGEALRLAKVEMVDFSQDATMNKLKYVLLGDPALSLAFPTRNVVIDSINGEVLENGSSIRLEAGAIAKFSGYVANSQNSVDTGFYGTVTGTVFDRLETITCKNNSGTASTPMIYQDRTKQLYEGTDSVRAGRFNLYMPVPRDISYTDDSGLLSVYAVNADHSLEAHGFCEQFHLNGTYAGAVQDTVGPNVFLYLNTPDFPNGGIVSSTPVFMANIQDDSGINASSVSVGHDMELTLDGNTADLFVLNDYFVYDFGSYSSGIITYPLENLSNGKHQLAFRVWDVNNNSTVSTLDFYVGEYDENKVFSIYPTQNPVREQTSFMLTLSEEHSDVNYEVEVYDLAGRKLWVASGTMGSSSNYSICQWNANDSAGASLPSGIYLYKAKAQSVDRTYETDAQKIILLKN